MVPSGSTQSYFCKWLWFLPHMLVLKVSCLYALCFSVSKWKHFVCQSTCGLCKPNQDNLMIIGLFKDEITLKVTLLMCNPTIISNILISSLEGVEKKLQPSMTSTGTSISFFTKTNLSCCINPLSMKHIDALNKKCLGFHCHELIRFDNH